MWACWLRRMQSCRDPEVQTPSSGRDGNRFSQSAAWSATWASHVSELCSSTGFSVIQRKKTWLTENLLGNLTCIVFYFCVTVHLKDYKVCARPFKPYRTMQKYKKSLVFNTFSVWNWDISFSFQWSRYLVGTSPLGRSLYSDLHGSAFLLVIRKTAVKAGTSRSCSENIYLILTLQAKQQD